MCNADISSLTTPPPANLPCRLPTTPPVHELQSSPLRALTISLLLGGAALESVAVEARVAHAAGPAELHLHARGVRVAEEATTWSRRRSCTGAPSGTDGHHGSDGGRGHEGAWINAVV